MVLFATILSREGEIPLGFRGFRMDEGEMDDLPLIEHDGRRFKLSSDYLTRVHRIADAFWVIVEVDEDGNELRMVEGWSSMIEPQSAWESAVEWLRKNGPEGVRWRS